MVLCMWQLLAHTDKMRSPFRSSPQRSAGPPARMKEIKIPSPSSPPTMLKPRPVDPRWSTTRLGSLWKHKFNTHTISTRRVASLYIQTGWVIIIVDMYIRWESTLLLIPWLGQYRIKKLTEVYRSRNQPKDNNNKTTSDRDAVILLLSFHKLYFYLIFESYALFPFFQNSGTVCELWTEDNAYMHFCLLRTVLLLGAVFFCVFLFKQFKT